MAKKRKTKEREDPLFIGLSEPTSIRRNVLESSKGLLILLRRMERIKEIREHKLSCAEDLRSIMKEVKFSFGVVKKHLPAVDIPKEPVGVKVQSAKFSQKFTEKSSELSKLEAEIAFIESKMREI